MIKRRTFLAGGLALAAGVVRAGSSGRGPKPPLRIGLTPVFLDDQVGFLDQWRAYLEARLSRPIEFVHRGSYHEVVELLHRGGLDAGWLCGYPYVRNRQFLRLLAVPEYGGAPAYRAYVIVHAADTGSHSLLDLRGRVFAFSDPDSNSGYLYPNHRLMQLQEPPHSFFGKTFFTWSHRKVVAAVAAGVAHGGAVDGYVWDMLARFHPELTVMTRVIDRSPEFGFPPLVARSQLGHEETAQVRRVLMDMRKNADGQALLKILNLTGFVAGEERLFDDIQRMADELRQYGDAFAA